jgi:vacuolar iron transporter family protein
VKPAREEPHLSCRGGWLRAAILGANDGLVATASLMIGVAESAASARTVLVAGIAGIVSGAMSMAAGEFVSVSSQRDGEMADIALERRQHAESPADELAELAAIYERRGLDPAFAWTVAEQLSRHDRLKAHLRDELGFHDALRARPLQAAAVSAVSFAALAASPVLAFLLAPVQVRVASIVAVSLASLGMLGALGATLGGAPRMPAALRVLLGGGLAMTVSALVGRLLGFAAP